MQRDRAECEDPLAPLFWSLWPKSTPQSGDSVGIRRPTVYNHLLVVGLWRQLPASLAHRFPIRKGTQLCLSTEKWEFISTAQYTRPTRKVKMTETIPSNWETVEKPEFAYITGESKQVQPLWKSDSIYCSWPSNSILRDIIKKNEHTGPSKDMPKNIHRNTIHIISELETSQMPTNNRMNIVIYANYRTW